MDAPATSIVTWGTAPAVSSSGAGYVHYLQTPPSATPETQAAKSPSAVEPVKSPLAAFWPRSVQIALAVLALMGTAVLAYHALGKAKPGGGDTAATGPRDLQRPLDLNRAGEAELRLLPGVGPKLAQRIIEHRDKIGLFRSVDDLRKVPGIGPVTFERLRSRVTVEDEFVDTDAASPPVPARTKTELARAGAKIDVNRASAAELRKIPGVGPVLSQNIVEYRLKNGPFRSVEDLCKVKGIKGKMLEKIKPFVTLGTDL